MNASTLPLSSIRMYANTKIKAYAAAAETWTLFACNLFRVLNAEFLQIANYSEVATSTRLEISDFEQIGDVNAI